MSKYILEYKKKYKPYKHDPVGLLEYMIFKDLEDSKKCVVLKLQNQSLHQISEIGLEMSQYDENNVLLSKSYYLFDQLDVGPHQSIIPFEKIKIDDACVTIESQLISAKSSHGSWQQGSWKFKESGMKPVIIEPSLKVTVIKYKPVTFPYFISFGFLFVFILIVIAVFYAINA